MDDEQVSTKSRELEPTPPEGEGSKTPQLLRKVSKVFNKKVKKTSQTN